MNIKGKKLSTYAAALIVALFGAGATMLIIDASKSVESDGVTDYTQIDPFSLDTDFGHSGTSTP